jgi:hydrogenase maturation protease
MNASQRLAPGAGASILLIGYGNEQRGDDGVGSQLARMVATWELPSVQTLAAHQLTPELAPAVAGADMVIFVDAGCEEDSSDFSLQQVGPATPADLGGHGSSPRYLLNLAEALYERRPRAWLLTIPASRFDFGAALSAATSRGMLAALRFLRDLIPSLRRGTCMR